MTTEDTKELTSLLPMVAKTLAYMWAKYKDAPVTVREVDAVVAQIMTVNEVYPTSKLWKDVASSTYDVLRQLYDEGAYYTLDADKPPAICLWQVATSMDITKEYTGFEVNRHVSGQLGIDMPTAIPMLLAYGYIRTHVVNRQGNYINVYMTVIRSGKDETVQ